MKRDSIPQEPSASPISPRDPPKTNKVLAEKKRENDPGPNSDAIPITDREAASRHFRDEKECLVVSETVEMYHQRIEFCVDPKWQKYGPGDVEQQMRCKQQVAESNEKIASLASQWNECGADIQGIRHEYEAAAGMAARLGDIDAQLCWYPPVDAKYHFSESDKAAVAEYYDQALKRGDWRFVEQGADTNTLSMLTYYTDHDDDPAEGELVNYRMKRLLRAGATGSYAEWLDSTSTTAYLSDEQKVAAETWAQQEYAAYFAKQPKLAEVPDSCADLIHGQGDLYKHPWRNGMMQ